MHDDAGQVLGHGEYVEALGKTWHLAEITQETKARYGALLRLEARRQLVEDARAGLDADAYKQALSVLNADVAAEKYAWGVRMGEAVRRSLDDYAGLERLALLLLEPHHKDVSPEDVQALFDEAPELMGLALNGLLEKNRKRPSPPKATA